MPGQQPNLDLNPGEMLRETYASTIRSEGKIDNIHKRLDAGDLIMKEHNDRIFKVERTTSELVEKGATRAKHVNKLLWLALTLFSYPAGNSIWQWLSKFVHEKP